jgi:hypothetical protein
VSLRIRTAPSGEEIVYPSFKSTSKLFPPDTERVPALSYVGEKIVAAGPEYTGGEVFYAYPLDPVCVSLSAREQVLLSAKWKFWLEAFETPAPTTEWSYVWKIVYRVKGESNLQWKEAFGENKKIPVSAFSNTTKLYGSANVLYLQGLFTAPEDGNYEFALQVSSSVDSGTYLLGRKYRYVASVTDPSFIAAQTV